MYHLAGTEMPFPNTNLPEDCQHLDLALNSNSQDVFLGQGGTSFRFFLATRLLSQESVRIHVDNQLKLRPIAPLLDALEELGLRIKRTWPLEVSPGLHFQSKVKIEVDQSSQFISSLALVGAFLKDGLFLEWTGEMVSKSFLQLTLDILKEWEISFELENNSLKISRGYHPPNKIEIEGDWASASYAIMGAAVRKQGIVIENLKENTQQPDETLKQMLPSMGVKLKAHFQGMTLEFNPPEKSLMEKNFSSCPDLAPTLCVWHILEGIPIYFTGLQTLNSKESKRLDKLAELLKDLQLDFKLTFDSLFCEQVTPKFPERYTVDTAGDHRLAMAFSDLCLRIPNLQLSEVDSVRKSFPNFWQEMSAWKIISK